MQYLLHEYFGPCMTWHMIIEPVHLLPEESV